MFLQRMFFERPDGPFNSIVRAIPELEEVGASIEAETEDDMELEELIVEAQMNETVVDQLTEKDDDCQVPVRTPTTGEKEAVEEVIGDETVEKETVTQEITETEPGVETTRTGRVVRKPDRLVENCTMALTALEYGAMLKTISELEYAEGEVCAVGAGSTNGFENTNELKVMKYEEAMKGPNRAKWEKAVEEEYQRFEANKCFQGRQKRSWIIEKDYDLHLGHEKEVIG